MRKVLAWLIEHIIGKIGIPWSREVDESELWFFRCSNLDAHILACHTPYQLSNLGINGEYKHIELITGPDNSVGAMGDGVNYHELRKILSKCDKYAVLEPISLNLQERKQVVKLAIDISDDNIEYDFEIKRGNKEIYCSELIVILFNKVKAGLFNYGKIIQPNELVLDKKNFKIIKTYEY